MQSAMPPDTTYIPGQTGLPPLTGNPYADSVIQSLWKEKISARTGEPESDWFGAISFPLLIIILIIALRWNKLLNYFGWDKKRRLRSAAQKIGADGHQYHYWLSQYSPYYKLLPEDQKKRFLLRTAAFIQSKEFRFHSMVAEDYIPVLISGAAIQLTFGLRNYLLDYFDVIHVMRREYVLGIDKETYYGHVSKNGIHISWNHFLEGYGDYTDSVNVSLHEMAHALQFDAYLGLEDGHDRNFRERLSDFSEEGRPVFRAMRKGVSHLLDDYAMTNFDEFWAVSVETFFENPQEFKEKLPALYEEMKLLLNQDPLEPGKVLNAALGW
ncbi:MAG: zinc-dependent peptidase [Bacteroidota bacterium]